MNKERYNQIIDEAYDNYRAKVKLSQIPTDLTKEEFVELCKNDITFSVYRGLKLEERELSLVERREIAKDKLGQMEWADVIKLAHYKETYDKYNIPKKLITLTYNNEILESYE
jgi:hypothetical protein